MYEQFCTVYEYNIEIVPSVNDFIDNNRLAISSYISNIDGLNGNDFTAAAQFVEFCHQIPYVYQLLCNQYLGSVITCFLEFKPKKAEMDVDLLFDTNFIISLLDLNTEASTKTCTKLLELSRSMGYTHHVLKDTIEETQALLYFKSKHYEEAVVYKYINKEDVFSACERLEINGTDLERIADNLETEIQKRGINIVYHTDDLTGKARYSTEYEILKLYANNEKWKEAWIRYYKTIYRDSYSRLSKAAFDINSALYPIARKKNPNEPENALNEILLNWVQNFEYKRGDEKSTDFTSVFDSLAGVGSDCDSRSMLMCILLKQNGINTTLFISREYSHAVYGAELNAEGAKTEVSGKEYLLGETTVKNLKPGLIAQEQNDTEKWIPVSFE